MKNTKKNIGRTTKNSRNNNNCSYCEHSYLNNTGWDINKFDIG